MRRLRSAGGSENLCHDLYYTAGLFVLWDLFLPANQKQCRTDEPDGMETLKRVPPKTGVPSGE